MGSHSQSEESVKVRFAWAKAIGVANELARALQPYCQRIDIAGSLRREKVEVGDIEIIFVPKCETRPHPQDMFATLTVDLASEQIVKMVEAGLLEKRKSDAGRESFGGLNKLTRHRASGIPVDFFTEPNLCDWWRTLVIRTGPTEFNLKMIAGAARIGLNLHAYGNGLTRGKFGPAVPCDSEEEFLQLCQTKWLKPRDRS